MKSLGATTGGPAHRGRFLAVMALLVALCPGLAATPAGADAASPAGLPGLTGQCGSLVVTAPIPNVKPGRSEDAGNMRLFAERYQHTLSAPLPVDTVTLGVYSRATDLPAVTPSIAGGTVVDSYLVHVDVPGEPAFGPALRARIAFDRDILGVMANGTTLDATDAEVGAPDTVYLNGQVKRGLEWTSEIDSFNWVDARTIDVMVRINSVVDEIRIITAGGSQPAATTGYGFVASDGGVFSFGNREFHGSTGNIKLNQPMVAAGATCTGRGYWLVSRDGGVFSFGDAGFFGSTGAIRLNQPITALASAPDDGGYWLFASDGGVFNFGSANFYGSMGKQRLNQPIVGAASTAWGTGYWMVARDGGIFAFGDAGFFGSTGAIHLNQPIVGMAATPSGQGYWMVAQDGGIFAFGDAGFFGSTGAIRLNQPIVGMRPTPSGQGYWMFAADGGVFAFGDATFLGSTGATHLNQPIVAVL